MPCILYGTSSWSEKSWVGPFYPAGTKPGDFHAHYATQFSTVEADNTYYAVPNAKLVTGWGQKTPAGFILSAKFPRSIAHGGEEATPDPERVLQLDHVGADLERYLASMSLLGDKCGPLVFQFPYFNQKVFKTVDPFLDRLDKFLAALPDRFRYGVEIRNKAWIDEPLLSVLRRRRAALVLVDIAYMPHPADLAQKHDLVTTDFSYVRLIGDRKAIDALTDRFDRIVMDQGEKLDRWAKFIAELLPRVEVYTYANNHYAGHGPETIRDLARRVEELNR